MVATLDRRKARAKHWVLIENLRQYPLHPREFKRIWKVTNAQLAKLLDLTEQQVERWFFKPEAKNYVEPEERHLKRLAEINYMWNSLDSCPPHIQEIYKQIRPQ